MIFAVLLLLLLVPVASASHNYGGKATFHYLGKNSDGTLRVNFRNKQTFRGCHFSHRWSCSSGYCGRETGVQRGTIDSSKNAPSSSSLWCESETVTTRVLPSDRPFQMKAVSCCWVPTRTHFNTWTLLASVDLGTRSDTAKPNRPPLVSGLSFIRVPENCPRTYNLLSFDPDGDRVRCRYGNKQQHECTACRNHNGFVLDQDTCTLQYTNTYSDQRKVFGFEMVVEDFPQSHITLTYSDGSQSYKFPLSNRWRRQLSASWQGNFTAPPPRTTAWNPWWRATSTASQTTAATTRPPWWWPTSTAATTTAAATTRPWWWSTSTAATTTAAATRRPWWWPTSTASPTTTTTTMASPTTTAWTTAATYHNSPLSKFPQQFSFLVDPPVPSCQEGKFLPRLLYPTPRNGAVFHAEVNKEMEFRVKAEAVFARISDILISGPLNISKHRNTHDEFVIRWMPTQDELGQHFPICFAVESKTSPGSYNHSRLGIYHSEMRCVRVVVVEEHVKSNVICKESMMKVEVEKTDYFGNHEDHFQLNNGANTVCEIQSNSTHIYVDVPLNACGTLIEEDEDYLYFKNEITTVDNTSALITRRHQLEVQFYCQYPKHGNVTLGFTAHRNNVTVMEKGFGTFTYQFEFFHGSQFRTMISPNLYPLEYDIGSDIFMQIEATSTANNTRLFVESCSAAPYDIPNYTPTYSIFENGCQVDPTIRTYPTNHSRQFRFSMESFKFIGQHDQVYISCSVMMCEAGNPNTRCAQGCQSSPQRQWKREAVSQSSLHFISQGPLRLRRSAELNEGSGMNLNLNLVFIAGCLLAAVAIASALFIYRAKMSAVRYQPLPTYET